MSLDITVADPTAHNFTHSLSELHQYCREQVAIAQQKYQGPADARRTIPPDFRVGDLVWLNAKNIKTKRPSKKLDHKRVGPFKISRAISTHAFRLDLPREFRFLHPVFHVSLLEPYHSNTIPLRRQPPPLPVEVDGETEYEVSAILDSRRKRNVLEYRVQWKGFDGHAESATWEPADNVSNAPLLLEAFHKKYPRKPKPRP